MALGNSDDVNFSLKEMQLGKRRCVQRKTNNAMLYRGRQARRARFHSAGLRSRPPVRLGHRTPTGACESRAVRPGTAPAPTACGRASGSGLCPPVSTAGISLPPLVSEAGVASPRCLHIAAGGGGGGRALSRLPGAHLAPLPGRGPLEEPQPHLGGAGKGCDASPRFLPLLQRREARQHPARRAR